MTVSPKPSSQGGVLHGHHPFRIFLGSGIVSIIALILAFMHGSWEALLITLILGLFEISISFDNAVVNARILEKMSHRWQQLFLTVGILIAVFGMRILFPLAIVGVYTGLNPVEAWNLALQGGSMHEVGTYSYYIHHALPEIYAFGGMFLAMIALTFLFEERDIKWLRWFEEPLEKIGRIAYAEVIVALLALLGISWISNQSAPVIVAGIAGMALFIVVNSLGSYFESRLEEDEEKETGVSGPTVLVGKAAFMSFIYLEVIDASFSFDGVIGALAITTDPVIIALGLGLIGAMFVRSITIFLVRKGTLNDYVYLDHGAHWAIGALALILLVSIKFPLPELVTGSIGIILIIAAFISSIIKNKRDAKEVPNSNLVSN